MSNTDNWIMKEGYETSILADATLLNSPGTEIQKVRFYSGKYAHFHRVKTEFFFVLSGEGEILMEDSTIWLSPGVSIIVPPGKEHTFIIPEGCPPLEALMMKTNSSPEDTYSASHQI